MNQKYNKYTVFFVEIFREANQQIINDSYENLKLFYERSVKEYEDMINTDSEISSITTATLIAEKIIILYGMQHLPLYFSVHLQYLKLQEKNGAYVQQDLIKLLSLILFAKSHHIISQNDSKKLHDACMELIAKESHKDINDEAQTLFSFYPI